jgi:hypothetical protein
MRVTPTKCPVCQDNHSVEAVRRTHLISATINGDPIKLRGTLAYRCHEGHVFMVLPLVLNPDAVVSEATWMAP